MIELENDIQTSCKTIDDARLVVTHLVNKRILDLVLIKFEYYDEDSVN